MDLDRTMAAIQWRMGLSSSKDNAAQDWEKIENWLRADSKRLEAVTIKMAEPLIEILRWGLFEEDTRESLTSSWGDLKSYLQKRRGLPEWMARKAATYILDSLRAEKHGAGSTEQSLSTSEPQVSGLQGREVTDPGSIPAADETTKEITVPIKAANSDDRSGAMQKPGDADPEADQTTLTMSDTQESSEEKVTEQPDSNPPDSIAPDSIAPDSSAPDSGAPDSSAPDSNAPDSSLDSNSPEGSSTDTSETDSSAPDSNPPSLATQWKYRPVPDDPEKHDEYDARPGESPEGLKIIGARVRGKKHKHEGTNCDDWFEFGNSGSWTIIAVSDGAGSKILSRIGAKESCLTALNELSDSLAKHKLKERESWSNETFKRDKQTGVFAEEDLEYVQKALHNAMNKAYEAVESKAQDLADGEDSEVYAKLLGGRKVAVDDLSGTLLLAVHTIVLHEGAERSFVLTCQIGDGMLAAINSNGGLQLLGIPDSGEFAGQTEFLTSKKKLEPANLTSKTFPFFGPLQALMVMSDGVADDYFPNDPHMLRLYGDLAINGILHLRGKNTQNLIDSSLAGTKLKNTTGVANAGLAAPVEAVTADGPRQIFIRSFETYAEKLGLKFEEVVKSTPLLIAGRFGDHDKEEMCPEKESEVMLRVWLDSYHVRGSFDDRTLVVLYREEAA